MSYNNVKYVFAPSPDLKFVETKLKILRDAYDFILSPTTSLYSSSRFVYPNRNNILDRHMTLFSLHAKDIIFLNPISNSNSFFAVISQMTKYVF